MPNGYYNSRSLHFYLFTLKISTLHPLYKTFLFHFYYYTFSLNLSLISSIISHFKISILEKKMTFSGNSSNRPIGSSSNQEEEENVYPYEFQESITNSRRQIIKNQPLTQCQVQISGYVSQSPDTGMFHYSKTKMIEGLNKLIIADDLPLDYGENEELEYWVRTTLQPQYEKVPRGIVKLNIFQSYYQAKIELIDLLIKFDGRVDLSSDIWTTYFGESYLCITMHWVDSSWMLQKRIIGFDILEEQYTPYPLQFERKNNFYSRRI